MTNYFLLCYLYSDMVGLMSQDNQRDLSINQGATSFVYLPVHAWYYCKMDLWSKSLDWNKKDSQSGFARGIILARGFMCQPEALWQAPTHLLFLQGDLESISADHAWLWYCNFDWNMTVYPALHVRNGIIHFSAMSWLKFTSTNRAYLPSMPYI